MPRVRGATRTQRQINTARQVPYVSKVTTTKTTTKEPVQSPSGTWWFPFNYLQQFWPKMEDPSYPRKKRRPIDYGTQRLPPSIPDMGFTSGARSTRMYTRT